MEILMILIIILALLMILAFVCAAIAVTHQCVRKHVNALNARIDALERTKTHHSAPSSPRDEERHPTLEEQYNAMLNYKINTGLRPERRDNAKD